MTDVYPMTGPLDPNEMGLNLKPHTQEPVRRWGDIVRKDTLPTQRPEGHAGDHRRGEEICPQETRGR